MSKRRDDDSDDVVARIEKARSEGAPVLDLSGRGLTALPESIGQLTQLQQLYIYNNQLTALPESMRNLTLLEKLYLHENDALGLPAEVLGPTWQDVRDKEAKPANPADILEYYFRVCAGKRPLNEAKLILVGRGAVGKTSLVKRLVNDRFDKREQDFRSETLKGRNSRVS